MFFYYILYAKWVITRQRAYLEWVYRLLYRQLWFSFDPFPSNPAFCCKNFFFTIFKYGGQRGNYACPLAALSWFPWTFSSPAEYQSLALQERRGINIAQNRDVAKLISNVGSVLKFGEKKRMVTCSLFIIAYYKVEGNMCSQGLNPVWTVKKNNSMVFFFFILCKKLHSICGCFVLYLLPRLIAVVTISIVSIWDTLFASVFMTVWPLFWMASR